MVSIVDPPAPATRSAPSDVVELEDDASFESRYQDLFAIAYRASYRLTLNPEQAADHAQETMTRAYLKWHQLGDTARQRAWVVRVSTNLTIDVFRRRATAERCAHFFGRGGERDVFADVVGRLDVRAALAALPSRQRDVVALRVLSDMSEKDTALALGCTERTVSTHLGRGLLTLRERIDLTALEEGGEAPPTAPATADAAKRTATMRRARRRLATGIAALLVVAVGVFSMISRPDRAPVADTTTTTTTTQVVTTTAPEAAISTDPVDGPAATDTAASGAASGSAASSSGSAPPGAAAPGPGTGETARGETVSSPAGAGAPSGSGADGASSPSPTVAAPVAPSGRPSGSNTGVAAGSALVSRPTIVVSTAGTVIENADVDGCIVVNAPDVTIRNTRITIGCIYAIEANSTNLLVEDVEIIGNGTQAQSCGVFSHATLRRLHVRGCKANYVAGDHVEVASSYFHDLSSNVGSGGGDNIRIIGNHIDGTGTDGPLLFANADGTLGSITIADNWITGGGYGVFGSREGSTNPPRLTVTGNVFGTFAYATHTAIPSGAVWANNTHEADGSLVAR